VAFQRSQANLDDADERLRLARWCLSHGLKEIALVEARAALELRPGHAETKQLIAAVQRSPLAPSAPAPPPLPPRPVEPLPNLDLSADALTSFTTKVQPILMNACASCHAGGQGGGFQLLRPYEGGTRFTTQRNLTATVMQLKFDHLAASPLLVKAVSAHGSATSPPLKDRQSVPFRALQQWAENVVANNPHLVERRPTPSVAAMQPRSGSEIVAASNPGPRLLPSTPPPIVSQPAPRRDGDLVPSGFANAQQALASGQPPALPSGPRPSNAPAPTANPNDVVDPTPFNRRQ
ncbi:MAG: hypothetical protein NZO58_13255, partial [Gemmataceae bacterium]|nr:hypothetical protein [Gemmataceae bacterium]